MKNGGDGGAGNGLVYLRGAEVVELKDEEGKLMNDFTGKVTGSL